MCYLIPAVVFSCLAQKTSFLGSLRQIWVVNDLFFFFLTMVMSYLTLKKRFA